MALARGFYEAGFARRAARSAMPLLRNSPKHYPLKVRCAWRRGGPRVSNRFLQPWDPDTRTVPRAGGALRLNATLRRLLDTRSTSSRMRVAELLGKIRAFAARHAENPPEIGIDVLSDLDLLNVHQRTFWEPPVRFEELQLSNVEQSDDDRLLAFKHLAEMQRLDWETMRSNISHAISKAEQVPLRQLLEDYPAIGGPLEVLGYIQLAHEDGHLVDSDATEAIHLRNEDNAEAKQSYEVPKVVFLSQRLRLFSQSLAIGDLGDE